MLLSLKNVTKSFPGEDRAVRVLDGISLDLAAGQSLALTGESGSGKSTLLHIAAGLEQADSGTVTIEGTEIGTLGDAGRARLRRDRIGIVFQQFNLIPSLTVAANIAFQARLAGTHDPDRTTSLLARLGLADHAKAYPEQLSGGQQQRVAIGRALAGRPALLLADEPTGNLDETTGDTVITLLLELASETGAGVLMVTHSERLAARLDGRVHLSHGRIAS